MGFSGGREKWLDTYVGGHRSIRRNALLPGQFLPALDIVGDQRAELGRRERRGDGAFLQEVAGDLRLCQCLVYRLGEPSHPIRRSLPAGTRGSSEGPLAMSSCVWLPIRSVTAGAMPRYGMWRMSRPLSCALSSSVANWFTLPAPDEA